MPMILYALLVLALWIVHLCDRQLVRQRDSEASSQSSTKAIDHSSGLKGLNEQVEAPNERTDSPAPGLKEKSPLRERFRIIEWKLLDIEKGIEEEHEVLRLVRAKLDKISDEFWLRPR